MLKHKHPPKQEHTQLVSNTLLQICRTFFSIQFIVIVSSKVDVNRQEPLLRRGSRHTGHALLALEITLLLTRHTCHVGICARIVFFLVKSSPQKMKEDTVCHTWSRGAAVGLRVSCRNKNNLLRQKLMLSPDLCPYPQSRPWSMCKEN